MSEQAAPTRVAHIGFLVDDVTKAGDFYTSAFRVGPFQSFKVGFSNVRLRGGGAESFTLRIALAKMGGVDLELIEAKPLAGTATYFDEVKLSKAGCMHHVAFSVPNLDESIAQFKKAGVDLVMRGEFTGGRFAYLDSEQKAGILFELVEMAPR